jgi:hypothetical protein
MEVWSTLNGRKRLERKLTASDGKLSLVLPSFSRDVAVKLKFLGTKDPGVQSTAGWTPEVPAQEGK